MVSFSLCVNPQDPKQPDLWLLRVLFMNDNHRHSGYSKNTVALVGTGRTVNCSLDAFTALSTKKPALTFIGTKVAGMSAPRRCLQLPIFSWLLAAISSLVKT
jgi:hypothetical protein